MVKLILPAIHLFGLVAFIIYKTKGSMVNFMKTRHAEVSAGLNKAKTQAAMVDAKKKEVETKFASLEKEKAAIFAEWKERESAKIKTIQEGSSKVIQQMKVDAEKNRATLVGQARNQVMRKFANLIIERVEEKVKAGLANQTHEGIHQKFVKEVSA